MRIGIDASNIGGGGGLTHLKEILTQFKTYHSKNKIDKIVIFGSLKILNQLPDNPLFEKVTFPNFNLSLLKRIWFQFFKYDKEINQRCDIIYSVAGDYFGKFKPCIGMSRNMLLYERDIWYEIKQPKEVMRFWLNYIKQKRSFNNSFGIIFISDYAQKEVKKWINLEGKKLKTINHGVSDRFSTNYIKINKQISDYTISNPFKLIYISPLHVYKHQWNVVKAVKLLREQGYPIQLDLFGGVYFEPSRKKLMASIEACDPESEFVTYHGHINYNDIHRLYKNSNGIVFASTCENMPNILIESMASGLPIACSDKQPMPEFLKKNGFYFNSYNVASIASAIEELINNPEKQKKFSKNNLEEVKQYNWADTSRKTFQFIVDTYLEYIAQKSNH